MRKKFMIFAAAALAAGGAIGQEAPPFFEKTYPEHALDEAWTLYGTLGNDEASLNSKTRELIALAVSAQIPCQYCVYAHAKMARKAGATEAEVREAVATAANVRMWSTVLNGMGYDFETFKAEHDAIAPPMN